MKHEFTKITDKNETRYVLENATAGGTSSGSVASVDGPLGKIQKRDNILAQEADTIKVPVNQKPRQGPLRSQTGAGAHRDKKKEQKSGKEKHRKPFAEDDVEESGLQYHTGVKKHGEKYMKMAAAAGRKGASQAEIGRLRDKYSKAYKEGVAEGFDGEYDDEAGMAHNNLLTSARAVMGLLKTIDDKDNLPEWVQEKIAKAEMMLVGVWDYLQSQKAMGNDPQVDVAEGEKKGLYYYVNKRKKAGTSRKKGAPGSPTAQAWKDAAKTAKKEGVAGKPVNELKKSTVKSYADKKQAELDDVPPMPFKKPAMSRDEHEKAAKGMMGALARLSGKKPTSEGVAEVSDATKQSYKEKAQAQVRELEPHAKKGEYKDIAQRAIDRRQKGLARVKEDSYMQELASKMAEKLDPNADPDVWVQDFQKADPNKYHQFKNKTPEKKAQMAIAARYAAKQPKSK